MKSVVPGGAGAMAWPGVIHLLEQPDITEILPIDLDKAALEERKNSVEIIEDSSIKP